MWKRGRRTRFLSRFAKAGPLVTAMVLSAAMLSQAGLALVHGLSHLRDGVPAASAAAHIHHHDHDHDGSAHDHGGAPANPGQPGSPAGPIDDCSLCDAIMAARAGWTAPPPVFIAFSAFGEVMDERGPPSRVVQRPLTIAAPRGPPARA